MLLKMLSIIKGNTECKNALQNRIKQTYCLDSEKSGIKAVVFYLDQTLKSLSGLFFTGRRRFHARVARMTTDLNK
jgi:hypothetical protein